MFAILSHFGLGSNMINWISTVYAGPSARVRANGVSSDPFPIMNGTRQGCPVPLEPFLCHVRRNPDISGIEVDRSQQKVSAHADDMMVSITNPTISLPNLLRKFERYGTLANLKINF